MSSLRSFTDTLQSIADKDDRIIMCQQEPDFSNARQLLASGMISARVDGNPEHPTRLAACRLTTSGALALIQWQHEIRSLSITYRAFAALYAVLLVVFGVIFGQIGNYIYATRIQPAIEHSGHLGNSDAATKIKQPQ